MTLTKQSVFQYSTFWTDCDQKYYGYTNQPCGIVDQAVGGTDSRRSETVQEE